MKLNINHRKFLLIYLSIACLGMIILASSIGNLEFRPGLPIPGAITNHPSMTTQPSDTFSSIDKNSFNPVLIEIGLGLSFLILFVMTLYSLVRKIERRKVGTMIIGLIVILIIFKLIQEIQPINHDSIVDQRIELSVNTTIDPEIVPIETPPSILFWLVVISLTFLTLGVLLFIISKVVQKPQQVNSYVEEANTALQAIYGGKDLGNIIINCYEQFIRLIKEEYEIEREHSLTAREFENYLLKKGIPITPIHQITSLFEKVRYGNKPTDLNDERIAIESLSSIRFSCQKKRESL